MKTIGLIGGMSWESTTEYYRIINDILIRQGGCPVPLFDNTAIHAEAAVQYALRD